MFMNLVWEYITLKVEMNDNSFVHRWVDLMKEHNNKQHTKEVYLVAFDNSSKDIAYEKLRSIMININEDHPNTIPMKYINQKYYSQNDLNFLHNIYETIANTYEWITTGKFDIKESAKIRDLFNDYIHLNEPFTHSRGPAPRLRFRYVDPKTGVPNARKVNLNDEDYDLFQPFMLKNRIYLNYCQVGKDLMKQYKSEGNFKDINPLKKYSPSFWFILKERDLNYQAWRYCDVRRWIKENNLDPDDKFLANGYIELGAFGSEYSTDEIMVRINKNKELQEISFT